MITTMKKIYQTPNTIVVGIKTQKMLAASELKMLGDTVSDKNAVLGRQDNSWDIWGGGDDEE